MKRLALAAVGLGLIATGATAQRDGDDFERNPAFANYCPRGLKFAAGACVTQCPAGYEDRGRFCLLRNYNTGRTNGP